MASGAHGAIVGGGAGNGAVRRLAVWLYCGTCLCAPQASGCMRGLHDIGFISVSVGCTVVRAALVVWLLGLHQWLRGEVISIRFCVCRLADSHRCVVSELITLHVRVSAAAQFVHRCLRVVIFFGWRPTSRSP